jgi:hypothetical protein
VAGPDIILAHQFLKNEVGLATYVLFTEAALARIGLDPGTAGLARYQGRYPHFGEVSCFVAALDPTTRRQGVGEDAVALGLRWLLGEPAPGSDPVPDELPPVVAA